MYFEYIFEYIFDNKYDVRTHDYMKYAFMIVCTFLLFK